jgi:cyclic pyranopterin phosphate synthase
MLTDSFGRKIDYLRLSVTDSCNLRCVYCLPEPYRQFTPQECAMSDEEILALISCFVELGVSKIRVTGGEPLARPGICGLIRRLSEMEGISDLSMSTNCFSRHRLRSPRGASARENQRGGCPWNERG